MPGTQNLKGPRYAIDHLIYVCLTFPGHIFHRGRQRLLNGNLRHCLSSSTYNFRQRRELLVPGLFVDACSPCPGAWSQTCPFFHDSTLPLQARTVFPVQSQGHSRSDWERLYSYPVGPMEKKELLTFIPPQDRHISAGLKQVGTRLDAMKKVIRNYINKVLFSHKQPKLRCVWARAAAIEMNTLPRTCLENFKIDDDQHRYTAGGVCDWSFCSGTRGAWVCSPQDLGWVTGNHSCIPCMSKGGSGQGPGPSSVSARLYYLAFGIDVHGRCLSVGPRSRAALESSPAGPSLTPCL